MKSFNDHSGLRGPPCLAEGIYWATGSSLTTPFTEGSLGVNDKAPRPGRHQEQAPELRCTFSPTTFSSVQFSFSSIITFKVQFSGGVHRGRPLWSCIVSMSCYYISCRSPSTKTSCRRAVDVLITLCHHDHGALGSTTLHGRCTTADSVAHHTSPHTHTLFDEPRSQI